MKQAVAGMVLRMRQDRDYEGKPKGYKHTYRVMPEGTSEVLFACDVLGHVTAREICFLDGAGGEGFSMRPNRKIMPTQWPVDDLSGRNIGYIKQKILGKTAWTGFDASGTEVFRIVNAESRVDRVGNSLFGGAASNYAIVQGDRSLAAVGREPREKTTKKGLRGFLQALVTSSDWVIRFAEDAPDLDIRLVLPAMILLIDLTVPMDAAD